MPCRPLQAPWLGQPPALPSCPACWHQQAMGGGGVEGGRGPRWQHPASPGSALCCQGPSMLGFWAHIPGRGRDQRGRRLHVCGPGFRPSSSNSSNRADWASAGDASCCYQPGKLLCPSLACGHKKRRGIFWHRAKSSEQCRNLGRRILNLLRARYCCREKMEVKIQWLTSMYNEYNLYVFTRYFCGPGGMCGLQIP